MAKKGTKRTPAEGELYESMDPRDEGGKVIRVLVIGTARAEVENVSTCRKTRVRLDSFYEADAALRSGYRHRRTT
jgi:hypothetical protein